VTRIGSITASGVVLRDREQLMDAASFSSFDHFA
jgi:hypothetical protein